jgi:hypothetical protein
MTDAAFEAFVAPWRQTFPALALAELYASPDEATTLLARAVLIMEWCDAIWRASDERVTTAKLGWWAEEWERALVGQGQHPISTHLRAAPVSAPLLKLLREREGITLDDWQARVDAYQSIGAEFASAFAATGAGALAWSVLVASRHLAALWSAHMPAISTVPMNIRARHQLTTGPANATECQSAAMDGAQSTASALQNQFARISTRDWSQQRGLRVLTHIALRELQSLGKPPSRLDSLSNGLAAWRTARSIT